MNKIIFYFLAYLGLIIFSPHLLILLYMGKGTRAIIHEDIIANRINNESRILFNFCALMWNPYFNTLFFHRIKDTKFRYFLYHIKESFYINNDVLLGKGCKLDHPFSTIINAKVIGNDFRIKNNVTIGNRNDNEQERPIIGHNVYVGANSVIIGKVTIGNNVTIGAGAIVTKDVPDNSTVVGINQLKK